MTGTSDHGLYADWDGAYVLGALAPGERREYEAHLEACDRCRLAVADLSGMPGLLGRIERDRAFSLLDAEADGAPLPPADLVARIEQAEQRRRRRRLGIVGGVAAAAIVAAAVAIPVTIASLPHPAVAVALAPTTTSPLSAEVQLTSVAWGTRIDMECGYRAAGDWADARDQGDWVYALWVVGADGSASEVSTWTASSGSQVRLTAATALSVDRIARIEVRSAATGDVLLAKRL